MRILYFSPRDCWPLTTGARIRDYQLASHLSRTAQLHYVGLCPRGTGPTQSQAPGFPQTFFERDKAYSLSNILRGFAGPIPITVLNYTSDSIRKQLLSLMQERNFDSVQIEGVHLVEYVPLIRKALPQARIIADWHNTESEIMRRYAETAANPPRRVMARRTAPLIELAENKLLRACDAHSVVSAREKEKLLARYPAAKIEVVPNGVDVEYYANWQDQDANVGSRAGELLFVGSMDYHANIEAVQWFVSAVWPRVKASFPDLKFRIVGRSPAPEVVALASPDVIVTGTVDDIRPFYAAAMATIVPLRVGGGTRLKILESMAARTPVISTRLGAEGIEARDGEHLLLGDTPEQLTEAIGKLAGTPELAEKLKENGLDLVKRVYDWSLPAMALLALHSTKESSKVLDSSH